MAPRLACRERQTQYFTRARSSGTKARRRLRRTVRDSQKDRASRTAWAPPRARAGLPVSSCPSTSVRARGVVAPSADVSSVVRLVEGQSRACSGGLLFLEWEFSGARYTCFAGARARGRASEMFPSRANSHRRGSVTCGGLSRGSPWAGIAKILTRSRRRSGLRRKSRT